MRDMKAADRLLEHDVHGGSDAACEWVVYTVPRCVKWLANYDSTESVFAEFAAHLIGTLTNAMQPKTRNFDVFGSIEIELEIVYNNTRIKRLLSLGPPWCAYYRTHWAEAKP
jgi:hypothetical protein